MANDSDIIIGLGKDRSGQLKQSVYLSKSGVEFSAQRDDTSYLESALRTKKPCSSLTIFQNVNYDNFGKLKIKGKQFAIENRPECHINVVETNQLPECQLRISNL